MNLPETCAACGEPIVGKGWISPFYLYKGRRVSRDIHYTEKCSSLMREKVRKAREAA